jgi:hypothetical protein
MMPPMTELSGYVLEPLREDAGFALYRGRQHQSPVPLEIIAATLAYMAPEQTGRMKAAANSPRGANFYFTLPLTHRYRNDDHR